ncbi:hypothetical protein C0995_005934 [Termitomyces sp. Mi166|nr:hypothetical protein C0995_005934 [Termitomyces sp. Mi166\
MSLFRVALVIVQTVYNHYACTPPNPTPTKGRYHTEEVLILQIAPLVFKACRILGAYIRLDCFRTLGHLFTFDLTVDPNHTLVTRRLYSYVRHPAYAGSMLVVAGLAFSHLSKGAWLTSCGPLRIPGSAPLVWIVWWTWTLGVGLSRAQAEDNQMMKLFKEEWVQYSINTPWWFFPGMY